MSDRRPGKRAVKKQYGFIAMKEKQVRTFNILADDDAEAEIKAKKKYPEWNISPYPANT